MRAMTTPPAPAIALMAVRIAKRPADTKRTFCYHRFEILAAAFNAMLVFGVAVVSLGEACLRLKALPENQAGATGSSTWITRAAVSALTCAA